MTPKQFKPVSSEVNQLSRVILNGAFKVHKKLGPGLLETTYRLCLLHELRTAGLTVEQEVALPIIYEGVSLETGYRLDLLVQDLVVVEMKAVDTLLAIHQAQLLSYLKHSDKRLELLINFNSILLKDGIRRLING